MRTKKNGLVEKIKRNIARRGNKYSISESPERVLSIS